MRTELLSGLKATDMFSLKKIQGPESLWLHITNHSHLVWKQAMCWKDQAINLKSFGEHTKRSKHTQGGGGIKYISLWTWSQTHQNTCNMRACGECTKIEGLSLGDDSRQSCASVALGLYVKAMALDSFPSYNNCLWWSARNRSLSPLNLKVP